MTVIDLVAAVVLAVAAGIVIYAGFVWAVS